MRDFHTPHPPTGDALGSRIFAARGRGASNIDATLLARANQTGTQLSSTISDFAAATDARIATAAAAAGGGPIAGITVTASPFTYAATAQGFVMVALGSVSLVEFGRSGSFATIGLLAGMFPVRNGDSIRVTYVLTPTMTFVPM